MAPDIFSRVFLSPLFILEKMPIFILRAVLYQTVFYSFNCFERALWLCERGQAKISLARRAEARARRADHLNGVQKPVEHLP